MKAALRELWSVLRGPRCDGSLSPLEFQLALAQQFSAWMAIGFLLFVPPGLVLLVLAFVKGLAR